MQVYLVGGAVRDALLNRKVVERDYVVVGATPEEMLSQGFTQVGKDFPVFLHPKTQEEYALARTERKSGKGYTGFVCDASASVTLEEDLLRRDLTVNAIAQDNLGNLIDPYHGKRDLENRLLRHVSEAFSEDPLRVFRVARFATRYAYLGFNVAPETLSLMSKMADSGELSTLSAERVWQETKRSVQEKTPYVFFDVLKTVGALNYWFKELIAHYDESIETLKRAPSTSSLVTRCTSLMMPLSSASAKALCQRLKMPNQISDIVSLACQYKTLLLSASNETCEEADRLLALFNGTDAWRRPDRFVELLDAVTPFASYHNPSWRNRKEAINKALEVATGVNVQDIIANGFKGPLIKAQLDAEKKSAIAQYLSHTL
ncbi:CCA tRNA nucleotidyltransferase [Alteromonas gracilis]|uniref:CCA tRNA nucleotidyltransferase n=1 Tax=Alteromonas gracilis TaxID=1479524 RepID=UPI003735B851